VEGSGLKVISDSSQNLSCGNKEINEKHQSAPQLVSEPRYEPRTIWVLNRTDICTKLKVQELCGPLAVRTPRPAVETGTAAAIWLPVWGKGCLRRRGDRCGCHGFLRSYAITFVVR
jgi:hypothetical protein